MAFRQLWLDSTDLDTLCTVLRSVEDDIDESRNSFEGEELIKIESLERRVKRLHTYIDNVK